MYVYVFIHCRVPQREATNPASHLILCLYVGMYVCPSHLGMLIFCTQCVLEVYSMHMWLRHCQQAGQQGSVHEYLSIMNRSVLQERWTIDPTKDEGNCMQGRSRDDVLSKVSMFLLSCTDWHAVMVRLAPLLEVEARCTCTRHYCIFVTLVNR